MGGGEGGGGTDRVARADLDRSIKTGPDTLNSISQSPVHGRGPRRDQTACRQVSASRSPHLMPSTARVAEWQRARLQSGRSGLLLVVGCLMSQQQASVSQGRICSDNFTCYHTEIEVADPTFYLTQSQYTDTGPTNPSTDPITPGAWQGSHWSTNV